jgi:hypothetical protein
MAKATKSRKPKPASKAKGKTTKGGGERTTGAKVKPRKAAGKASMQKKASPKVAKASAAAAKPSKIKAESAAKKAVRAVDTLDAPIRAGAVAAVLPRPDRPAPRPSLPRTAAVAEQPAESETPPALPVPIASFTF